MSSAEESELEAHDQLKDNSDFDYYFRIWCEENDKKIMIRVLNRFDCSVYKVHQDVLTLGGYELILRENSHLFDKLYLVNATGAEQRKNARQMDDDTKVEPEEWKEYPVYKLNRYENRMEMNDEYKKFIVRHEKLIVRIDAPVFQDNCEVCKFYKTDSCLIRKSKHGANWRFFRLGPYPKSCDRCYEGWSFTFLGSKSNRRENHLELQLSESIDILHDCPRKNCIDKKPRISIEHQVQFFI